MRYDPPLYSRLLQAHRRALTRLRLDLKFFLEESGPVLVVGVEHRVKSFEMRGGEGTASQNRYFRTG